MHLIPTCAATALLACVALGASPALAAAPQPPVAPQKPVIDRYFGTEVVDPYRWMEDLTSPDVIAWAKAQDAYTRGVLAQIPGRNPLLARIKALEASVAARVTDVRRIPDGRVFYEKRGADDNQFKVYVRNAQGRGERLLVDPDALAKTHGEPYAVTFFQPSPSGRYLAYGLSTGGSEEASIHVLDVATLAPIGAPIDRAHYSGAAWMPDEGGFFLFRQRALPPGTPETEKYRFQTAYYHALDGKTPDRAIITAGESKAIDIAADEFPEIDTLLSEPWVVAIPRKGVQNEITVYVKPRAAALDDNVPWRKIVGEKDDVTNLAVHGDDLFLLTHKDASRFKVLRTSFAHPDLATAAVVLPASREVITDLVAAKDALYIVARDGTLGKLYRLAYAHDAKPVALALPRAGSVELASPDSRIPGVLVQIGSWTHDFTYYAYDPVTHKFTDTGLQPLGPFGAPANLASKEVLVRSHDGVEVPLSIVHPKHIKLDGSNPVLLYGYGAYGITDDPFYIPRYLAWYEQGGVRATCHVRGGGAFGEDWHLAGKQAQKPNTWKDLAACAKYLIDHHYTTTARLAINGGSAGGILVGRAMTADPELYGVAVPQVGVLNALLAETSANGGPNVPEFGTFKVEAQFHALLEMDALHHVVDGVKYPATLVTTGINDPRVPPWESFKFAARLQAATSSGKPVLLRVDFAGGHGIGATKTQRQEETADIWSFMLWQFGMPKFQPAQ
jgi:prolyl oligopeptidase